MFGGRGMFDDPLFGAMHSQMRRQMDQMDELMGGMMMDPFGMMQQNMGMIQHRRHPAANLMIEDDSLRRLSQQQQQQQQQLANRPSHQHRVRNPMDPFDDMMGFGGLLGGFGRINNQMEQFREQAVNDPNSHVYSHSTVISFGPGGQNGQPQYYEATNSVHKAGDIKEVRRTVRDSAEGEERMTIGHHMGDRAHIIEKRRGRDGKIREQQQFKGLSSDQAEDFDREWGHVTRGSSSITGGAGTSHQHHHHPNRRNRVLGRLMAADSSANDTGRTSSPRRRTQKESQGEGPIITEVDDDGGPSGSDQDPKRRRQTPSAPSSRSNFHARKKPSSGPVIEEVE